MTLNNLQKQITTELDSITNYSQNWVNLLKQMLLVEELPRPDFYFLHRSNGIMLPYTDDDPIWNENKESELKNPLEISVKCGLSYVRVSQTLLEEVPCMISLKTLDIDPNNFFIYVDIVAVIDESGSMAGPRLSMVQQTLMRLIDILHSGDRLSIVTFSDFAERKCPLTCCNQAGKEALKKIVTELGVFSLTNISAGFVTAMEVLEQRRARNTGTSIMLFTDGQHSVGPDPLSTCLTKYRSVADSKIKIFSFGYGFDVDSKLLWALAEEGNGIYYPITEDSQIKDSFGLAYAHLSTLVARNLRLNVLVNPGPVICTVPLVYSKGGADSFSLPDILANQQKNVIFMLKAEYKQLEKGVSYEPITVLVNYQDNEGLEYQQSINMSVKFVPWRDTDPVHEQNVFMNWYRMKGVYCFWKAQQLAENREFLEADKCLANGIELLMSSGFEAHEYIAPVIRNLQEARTLVQNDQSWQRGGDAHFASIFYSHYSQSASVGALHYSTPQENRIHADMNRTPLPKIPEKNESQSIESTHG